MAWFFRRGRGGEERPRKVVIAEGLWVKCESCKEIVYRAEVDRLGKVCPKCSTPFRLSARERLAQLLDEGSFEERDRGLRPLDPLNFRDTRRYRERVRQAREKTGLEEALISGLGRIGGLQVVICVFEFGWMGGSMASVVGEKITRAMELATRKHLPLIILSCSGGARMQEGILSLMQMAKTTAALARLKEEGIPFISVLADPTTGGVTASFASLGDIIIAEPRALIGFAGPRVIAETIRQPLPEGFQRAEFLLEHGMIDMIVERKDLRGTLRRILAFLASPESTAV